MEKNRIVIIDTGVDNSHPLFEENPIKGICFTYDNEGKIVINNNFCDEVGHGTAVCGILRKNYDKADIFMIKIYSNSLVTNEELLIYALDYIDHNIRCNIINMSIGILVSSERLKKLCTKLSKKGIILVAAFDNTGAVSYPAAYKEVIGVDASIKCIYPEDYIYVENGIINLYAKSGNIRLAWINKRNIIGRGISYTAAFMSANILKLMENNLDIHDIDSLKIKLKENAMNVYEFEQNIDYINSENRFNYLKSIHKVAIFPYNKEIQSLINFSEILSFEIDAIYDIKQHGYINRIINSLDYKKSFQIKNYKNIDYSCVDTIIIGHTSELSLLSKIDVKRELLEESLNHNKNVYCFDDRLVDQYIDNFQKKGLLLNYPYVNTKVTSKAGKLYGISSPVLGVFGTSSAQGKYTLQLQLRKLFLKFDYHLGQLGSEPSALLFGMDEVFPFGYESTIKLSDREYIETVNFLLHKIDLKNPDIIMVGCQSNTIPRVLYNIDHVSLPQIEFLLGSNPDVVILCVNIFDEIEYIERNILAIENLIECKVLALAISPFYYPNEWYMFNNKKEIVNVKQVEEFKIQLKNRLNIESFMIGTEEIVELFYKCINYLSE